MLEPAVPFKVDNADIPNASECSLVVADPEIRRIFRRGNENVMAQLVFVLPPVYKNEVLALPFVHAHETDTVSVGGDRRAGQYYSSALFGAGDQAFRRLGRLVDDSVDFHSPPLMSEVFEERDWSRLIWFG